MYACHHNPGCIVPGVKSKHHTCLRTAEFRADPQGHHEKLLRAVVTFLPRPPTPQSLQICGKAPEGGHRCPCLDSTARDTGRTLHWLHTTCTRKNKKPEIWNGMPQGLAQSQVCSTRAGKNRRRCLGHSLTTNARGIEPVTVRAPMVQFSSSHGPLQLSSGILSQRRSARKAASTLKQP